MLVVHAGDISFTSVRHTAFVSERKSEPLKFSCLLMARV